MVSTYKLGHNPGGDWLGRGTPQLITGDFDSSLPSIFARHASPLAGGGQGGGSGVQDGEIQMSFQIRAKNSGKNHPKFQDFDLMNPVKSWKSGKWRLMNPSYHPWKLGD